MTNKQILQTNNDTLTNVVSNIQNLTEIIENLQISLDNPTTTRIEIDNSNNEDATFDILYIGLNGDGFRLPQNAHFTNTTGSRELFITTNSIINIAADSLGSIDLVVDCSGDIETISNGAYNWLFYIPPKSTGGEIALRAIDCCFVPGTQILTTLDGKTESIENLKQGDNIISYNIETQELYSAKVKQLIINKHTTDIAEIDFQNGAQLIMNAYHPIYTQEGFHSLTKHNGYDELKIGDIVKTNDNNWTTITNIKRYISEPIITYNIDVIDIDEENDNEVNDIFFANGIAVHNASCPI